MTFRQTRRPARALQRLAALCAGVAGVALAAEASSPPGPPRRTADAAVVRTLQDHHWTLESASDAGGPMRALPRPGHPIVLDFDGATLSIRGACNQFNGAWRLSPLGQLAIGRLASTMRACEADLMAADEALAAVLAQPLGVEVGPGASPTLRLSSAARQTLSFSGQPTYRSLYGEPTRLFLEVAAQTVDCTLPNGMAGRCLQVRDRQYDEKGLLKGTPGPWRPFTDRIEGYAHTPGVRNVLRVDRYQRSPAPADGPAAVYVLDLVVESEIVSGR